MSAGDATESQRIIAGRYALVAKLGEGGFGSVYLARDQVLMRDVAVKVIPAADAVHRERVLREARATARLRHPHIVTIHDAGESGDSLYLVLELVAGRPLAELISPKGMDPLRATRIVAQIARALAAAHAAGIVHRDVKPSNILIDEEGNAKLTDFGIARLADDARITNTGTVIGTLRYMAPEQLRGDAVAPTADLYSLGLVAYELLTGRSAANNRDFTSAQLARAPVLCRAIPRLMSDDPAGRGTADALAQELGDRPSKRRYTLPIAVAASVAVIAIALFVFVRHQAPSRQSMKLHLSHATPALVAAAMDNGRLAGVPLAMTVRGARDIEVSAAQHDFVRAIEMIKLVDALAGYQFKKEPNAFTGPASSTRRISCSGTFVPADLLPVIAIATGWPLVMDSSAKSVPPMPLAVHDAPWDEVAQTVIARGNLTSWRNGDIWIVETQQRQKDRERLDPHQWVGLRLHRKDTETVVKMIRPLLSAWGAAAVSHTGEVIVCDTAPRVRKFVTVANELDPEPNRHPERIEQSRYTGKPVTLTLRDADLVGLLRSIARTTGVSLIVDPAVHGSVSVSLPDVRWDNAIDAILQSQGFIYRFNQGVVTVLPENKAYAGETVERTIHLQHEKPSFFRQFANAMAPGYEIVIADDASGTLVLRGQQGPLEQAVHVIKTIDEM